MARAPFQVVAFPVRLLADQPHRYALFRRRVEGYWQGIAGGGEDDETPLAAVQRESAEEAAIPPESRWIPLQTRTSVPVTHFRQREHWDADLLVIPVFYFGVITATDAIRLSDEHSEVQWVSAAQGQALLKWDSDRTALWELEQLLQRGAC